MKVNLAEIHQLPDEAMVDEIVAAAVLNNTTSALRAWRHQRKVLPYYKLGGVKYRMGDLRARLASCRVEPQAAA